MEPAEIGPSAGENLTLSDPFGGSGMFESSPFTQILETVPFGLFVLDASGLPVYSNSSAGRILQREILPDTSPDTLAEAYSAYLAGTDTLYPHDRMPIVRALAGETSTVTDMELRLGDTVKYLEVSGAPVFDANKRVKFAVAVFHDITATRTIEATLKRLADELATQARERSEQLETLRGTFADGSESEERNGDEAPERDDRIEPCGKCWAFAEFDRTRESAELANRALTLFIANFSHELRTPLNHIIGFSDLIESKIQRGVTKDIEKHAEDIRQSGASLLETLNKIISIAEAESSKLELSLEILDAGAIIREVTARLAPRAVRNGNRLEISIPDGLGLVQTDGARVRAALEQIVENACKHCRDGSVRVAASRTGTGTDGSIEITVTDTGRGIDPGRAARLVEGRVVPGDPLGEAGLGIGIPLAVQSLRALGGSLRFLAEDGGGTRFVIAFPTYTRA